MEADRYREQFNKHDSVIPSIFLNWLLSLQIKFGYYVARMHVWDTFPNACKGKYYRFSCIFGAEDLAVLLSQPHFIAHKFYMNYEPAGLICGLKVRQFYSKSALFF